MGSEFVVFRSVVSWSAREMNKAEEKQSVVWQTEAERCYGRRRERDLFRQCPH